MPHVIARSRAIVIRTMRMGETSKLVTLFSEDYGKIKVVAKGARKPKSKFGASLELMTEVQAMCYLREERDLQTLSDCDVLRVFPSLTVDLQRMSYGSAACEMVDRLTIEHEPNKRIYGCLKGILRGLEEVEREQMEVLFWYFQLRLAEALGYRPELGECVSCRKSLGASGEGEGETFSPSLGGGVCEVCNRDTASSIADAPASQVTGYGSPGFTGRGYRVAGASLRFLAHLQALESYRKEAIPRTPAGSGEIRRMLRAFLEYHGGFSGRLKALDFLDSVGSTRSEHG